VEISCTSIRAYDGMRSSSNQVTGIFLTLTSADGKNIQFKIHILSRPTLSIAVTETVVKAREVYSGRQKQLWKSPGSPHSTKAPTIFTELSLAPIDLTSKISSHHEHLHYEKMAAVSIMRMCTGSYAHIIALINFGIP